MAVLRLVVAIAACLGVLSCGSNQALVVKPIIFPEVRSVFYGDWRGTMSAVRFNPITIIDTPEVKSDVNCSLKFDLFQYELELIFLDNRRETVYSLRGEWKWAADDPGRLVFFNQQESMMRTLEFRGIRRSYNSTLSLSSSSQCKLEFTDGFNKLIMFDLDKAPGLSKFPDSAMITVIRNQ